MDPFPSLLTSQSELFVIQVGAMWQVTGLEW